MNDVYELGLELFNIRSERCLSCSILSGGKLIDILMNGCWENNFVSIRRMFKKRIPLNSCPTISLNKVLVHISAECIGEREIAID